MKKFIIILTVIFLLIITYPVKAKVYKTKSEATALMWSLGSTVTSIAGGIALINFDSPTETSTFKRKALPVAGYSLVLFGAYICPSTGHFYANQWHRGFGFIGLRAGITGVLSLIALKNIDNIDEAAVHLWFTGAILVLLTDIIDIYTVPSSVRKYNFEYGGIHLQPKIDLGDNSYGLNIVFNF
jgi:hypothetical protein